MKIAVWGSGAIGAVVGAAMAAAGEDVLLVDIVPEHVAAMNDRGLLIKSAAGERRISVRAALPAQVRGAADAARAEIEPVGLRPAQGDQLLDRLRRHRRVHHQEIRR